MNKCIKCGSYAFNLYKEDIDQGGLCDVHYWQGRAHRAEALVQPPAQDDPCPGCHKGVVCRTPKCGRLKLPVDHPYRSEQPAQQEPVVFYRCNGCGHAYEQVHPTSCDCMEGSSFEKVNYYTSPPAQRKPLTDEELDKSLREAKLSIAPAVSFRTGFRAAEAAHGIKENT